MVTLRIAGRPSLRRRGPVPWRNAEFELELDFRTTECWVRSIRPNAHLLVRAMARLDRTTFRLYALMSSADIIRKLQAAGWTLVRTKG